MTHWRANGRLTTGAITLAGGEISFVDEPDIQIVSGLKWHLLNGYVVTRVTEAGAHRKTILMHRLIMSAKPGEVLDHIDRDPLNNRRSNLRFCTPSQNSANRVISVLTEAGFRGVRTEKAHAIVKYRAEFRPEGKKIRGPRRAKAIEAAHDYDRMAFEHFGPFAVLNFPVSA